MSDCLVPRQSLAVPQAASAAEAEAKAAGAAEAAALPASGRGQGLEADASRCADESSCCSIQDL